jgi:hypothetical protein
MPLKNSPIGITDSAKSKIIIPIQYLVVAGGAGGSGAGSGGGAGGYRASISGESSGGGSSAETIQYLRRNVLYTVTVGAGGSGVNSSNGFSGTNSSLIYSQIPGNARLVSTTYVPVTTTAVNVTTRTAGTADDGWFTLNLPFTTYFNGVGYNEIHIGTNSYATFGGGSAQFGSLGPSNPAFPKIMVNAGDRGSTGIYYTSSASSWTMRYEGSSGTSGSPIENIWELFCSSTNPNTIRLSIGTSINLGISGIYTSNELLQTITPTAGTSYNIIDQAIDVTPSINITSIGGGGAGGFWNNGLAGGSGGGGGIYGTSPLTTGGAGTSGQGYAGGPGADYGGSYLPGGGGGGAGQAGDTLGKGYGGNGVASSITGSSIYRAGGGAGRQSFGSGTPPGGLGGGGTGTSTVGGNGAANTGGGGAGGYYQGSNFGGNGGSGIIILKYPNYYTISVGAGLTSTTSTVGLFKITQITSGTGTVSFS